MAAGCGGGDADRWKRASYEVADTNVVLPPSWAFGVLYGGYTNQQETRQRIEDILRHDYPIDAYWIDSWFWDYENEGRGPAGYLDFVGDTVAYPDRTAMWRFMEENNIKGGFWIWDCILQDGNEEAFAAFDEKGFFSSTFLNTNAWHNKGNSTAMFQKGKADGTLCGNIDFQNPDAIGLFEQKIKLFFEEGADFIKLDRTSDIGTCKVMYEMSAKFGRESKGRGFLLSHSDGTEREEFKRYPAKWTDDTRADWTVTEPTKRFNSWVPKVAFRENILMFTDSTKATSGIPFLTNDTGGFDIGIDRQPEEELFIRWVEFSTFNPIMEVFSQPENPTSNLAYQFSPHADSIFRIYSHLRMELFPYIYSNAHQVRIKGKRMIRSFGNNFQFFFGDEFFVAPVYEKSKRTATLKLPDDTWFCFWTGERFAGNDSITVDAPPGRLPLFVRAGAIIPMRPYKPSIEAGSNELLDLHLFPDTGLAKGEFELIEDDGQSNEYLSGGYSVTRLTFEGSGEKYALEISPIEGMHDGQLNNRKWRLVIHDPDEWDIHWQSKALDHEVADDVTIVGPFEVNVQERVRIEMKRTGRK